MTSEELARSIILGDYTEEEILTLLASRLDCTPYEHALILDAYGELRVTALVKWARANREKFLPLFLHCDDLSKNHREELDEAFAASRLRIKALRAELGV